MRTKAVTWGLRAEASRPLLDRLSNYLRPKQLLLILDNCEHLIAACAQLIQALLQACPDLNMVATSRAVLNMERAATALPGFKMTDRNAPAIAQICYRLDGMPLAIELAVARVKVMQVDQITTRLEIAFAC